MHHALVYDKNANVLSREVEVKEASIPLGINDYYKTRTANASGEYAPAYTVWEVTDKDGNITYYSEYKGKYAYFNKEGKQTIKEGAAEGDMDIQDPKMPEDKK